MIRIAVCFLLLLTNFSWAADFQTDILPIFQSKCYKCHGNGKTRGDMSLEPGTIGKFISQRGPIVPGDPDAQILRMLRHEAGEEAMPRQGGKLGDEQIAIITQWVVEGAKLGKGTPYALTQNEVLASGTWTNAKGQKIEAELLGVDNGKALLRMKGKVHQVPLESLSEDSQAKIAKSLAKSPLTSEKSKDNEPAKE